MKAISLWQPWASLIAIGAKSIETRSWPAPRALIGDRIAIHAAKTTTGFDQLPGDCEGTTEGGWRYGYIGDFQAGYCCRSSDEGRRGDAYLHRLDPEDEAWVNPLDIPLGAVVATARLLACVPMVWRDDWPDARTWQDVPALEVHASGLALWPVEGVTNRSDVTDQLPYGDFGPGRWAWLLADVERLVDPIPACGGQRVWNWRG